MVWFGLMKFFITKCLFLMHVYMVTLTISCVHGILHALQWLINITTSMYMYTWLTFSKVHGWKLNWIDLSISMSPCHMTTSTVSKLLCQKMLWHILDDDITVMWSILHTTCGMRGRGNSIKWTNLLELLKLSIVRTAALPLLPVTVADHLLNSDSSWSCIHASLLLSHS